jgi:hypothetical protein
MLSRRRLARGRAFRSNSWRLMLTFDAWTRWRRREQATVAARAFVAGVRRSFYVPEASLTSPNSM